MARKSYRQKKRYNYRRYGYYKPFGSKASNSLVARAWKSIKEANKTNTSIDFAFKINYSFVANYEKDTNTGVAAINCYDVLFKSENFRNMMKNYDQVKINGVTVRLNVTDYQTTGSQSGSIQTINVITGWDKTGLSVVRSFSDNESVGDVEFYDDLAGGSAHLIAGDNFDDNTKPAKGYRNIIGNRISEGYGAKKGLLNNYQKFSRYESCFPSTIEEKSQYVPTANFTTYSTGWSYTPTVEATNGLIQIADEFNSGCVNDNLSVQNPCLPFEQLGFNWKPTLLVGVFKTTISGGTVTQYGDCDNVVFNAEFTIPVTFKGQKGDRYY